MGQASEEFSRQHSQTVLWIWWEVRVRITNEGKPRENRGGIALLSQADRKKQNRCNIRYDKDWQYYVSNKYFLYRNTWKIHKDLLIIVFKQWKWVCVQRYSNYLPPNECVTRAISLALESIRCLSCFKLLGLSSSIYLLPIPTYLIRSFADTHTSPWRLKLVIPKQLCFTDKLHKKGHSQAVPWDIFIEELGL